MAENSPNNAINKNRHMAVMSGFRRYSNPAPLRRQQVQRGSLFSVTTTTQTSGYSWFYILQAMRKQEISLSAGLCFCTCAVLIYSHGIYDRLGHIYDGKKQYLPIDAITEAMYFLGCVIGSIVCGMYPYTWPAKRSNYAIGSILIVAGAFSFWINEVSACIVQFLAGCSYGFIYIALSTQIADNVMKSVRGYMATSFAVSATIGMIIGLAFSPYAWALQLDVGDIFRYVLNGTAFGLPICSLIVTIFAVYEPVTRLLRLNLENEAKQALSESRKGLVEDSVIQHEIDEKKLMLREDYANNDHLTCGFQTVFSNGNAMPLLYIIILRLLHVLTSNIYLNFLSAISIFTELNYMMHTLLMVARLFILFIPKYSIDKLGRRTHLLASGIGSGILLIPFAVHHMDYIEIPGNLLGIITFSIHMFAALGIEPVQHIYAMEAFPLSKRNASLAIATCFEYILQGAIAICLIFEENTALEVLLIGSPFVVLFLSIVAFIKLPETKSIPMRRCRDLFNKNAAADVPVRIYASSIQTLGTSYM